MRVYSRITSKIIVFSILTLLFLSQSSSSMNVGLTLGATTTVYVAGAPTAVLGSDVSISICIENVTNLAAWSFVLAWDPFVLEFANATLESFCYLEWGDTLICDSENASAGLVFLGAMDPTLGSPLQPHPLNGSGELAKVIFHSISPGECVFDLSDTSLVDGSPILTTAPPYYGDATGDLLVDLDDLMFVPLHMGVKSYSSSADFNSDSVVDMWDYLCAILNYGRNYNLSAETTRPVPISHQVSDGLVEIIDYQEISVEGETVSIQGNISIANCIVSNNTLEFDVSGPSGSTGRINVAFPKINTTNIKVFIDEQELTPPPFPVISDNGTHYLIYFEFSLSIHGVTLIFDDPFDMATTEITACKPVVGEGYPVDINVTVTNQGDYTESFNVSVFYDDTIITFSNGENYTTATVDSEISTTLTLTWNTSGVSKGIYTLSAYVAPIPGETDTGDNGLTGEIVRVGIPGDVDPIDGYVGIDDIFAIASHFGQEPSHPEWNGVYDINNDGYIGIDDIFIAASHFGEEEP